MSLLKVFRTKWWRGRHKTDYQKRLILEGSNWDTWLLRYPTGSHIPWHRDPIPNKTHFRLNIVLWRAREGGLFKCEGEPIWSLFNRIFLFRPDEIPHMVTKVTSGIRYVLSIGWARERKTR